MVDVSQNDQIQARRGRPLMPEGYGVSKEAEGLLDWQPVSEQIEQSRNYWLVTAGASGAPHAMPVWGVWVAGALYFSTGTSTRKAQNLAANPRLVVHLESGDDVVILRGSPTTEINAEALRMADEAYAAKYRDPSSGEGFHLSHEGDGDSSVYALHPAVVLAWREHDFPTSATRWRFRQS